ncbi:MAG TPA: peptidoglycan-binding protein [Ramlibacter sp.]|uniref:peptidoglycan-binding protein n=1 Tax=Ramlibacter sp. TaxID=1917967 RepID=UPI002D7E8B6E|nr:peptidoglycan-binding protein [Ramlibacter sp.]HET8744255.1 peptidoglycan-binding protein [Ramlibacter sp.]
MERSYFSKGCRGEIVIRLQQALQQQGFAPPVLVKFVDGDFGEKTATAVRGLQEARGFTASGEIDARTWNAALDAPLPSLFERALQLTADFEGHGFGLAQGNFDGAGITWGIIGFTLAGGELQRVMQEIDRRAPGTVDAAFGALAPEWRSVLAKKQREQIAWADGISLGTSKARLPPPWVQVFARLGALPVTQQVQIDAAREKYFEPALRSAQRLGLHTERGIALCFDTHVQSGSVRPEVFQAAADFPAGATEGDRLPLLAQAIAQAVSRPQFRADVLARRMCIATGSGRVHGADYKVASWGLGLFRAE